MADRLRLFPESFKWESWGSEVDELIPLTRITEIEIRNSFSSAGVLPISSDGRRVLLGAHRTEQGFLYGPFAGSREDSEEPETTAYREALEELGMFAPLWPPLVIINAARINQPKVGVIFPIIISEEINFQPNEEIEEIAWFSWDDVCGLMDESHPAWRLWGGTYTLQLLREWTRSQAELWKKGSYKGEEIAEAMNGVVIVQDYYFGETPYQGIKKRERKQK